MFSLFIYLCRTLSSGSWPFFLMRKVYWASCLFVYAWTVIKEKFLSVLISFCLHYLLTAARLWSKKDAVAREKVVKLVENAYRWMLVLAMDLLWHAMFSPFCKVIDFFFFYCNNCVCFHRRMQSSGESDLVSKGQVSSDISNVKFKGELEDRTQPDIKVRCICGSSLETKSMIQVSLWQHIHLNFCLS